MITIDDILYECENRTWYKKLFVWFRYRLINIPRDIKFWFYYRFHPSHRYNIVKLGLRPGYYDTDTRFELAMINLFIEHVEFEREGQLGLEMAIDYWQSCVNEREQEIVELWNNSSPDTEEIKWKRIEIKNYEDCRNLAKEMLELYNYFKTERPVVEKEIENSLHNKSGQYLKLHNAAHDKDTEMLKRMVEIRGRFWT